MLVPGQVVGVDVASGPSVDVIDVAGGRSLAAGDAGRPVAVLEQQFADFYSLPAHGTVRVSGGTAVSYVGVGTSPEYFVVAGRAGTVFAQAGLAVLFVPLETAQALLGEEGRVNEMAVLIDEGTDRQVVRREVERALAERLPGVGTTITEREDEPAYHMLYQDIEGDQRFWNIIALLVLGGATFAACNLTTRMVEAQRREIGIGMALGVPPARVAVRPVLVGAQIAAFGVLVGSRSASPSTPGSVRSWPASSRSPSTERRSSPTCSRGPPSWGSYSRSPPRLSLCGGRSAWRRWRPSGPATWPPGGAASGP